MHIRGLKEVTGWKNTYPHTVSYKVPQNPCPISYPKSHVLIWHPECIYVCKIRRYIWSKILQTFANFFDTHIFTRCMLICRCDGPKELGSEDGVREKSDLVKQVQKTWKCEVHRSYCTDLPTRNYGPGKWLTWNGHNWRCRLYELAMKKICDLSKGVHF